MTNMYNRIGRYLRHCKAPSGGYVITYTEVLPLGTTGFSS